MPNELESGVALPISREELERRIHSFARWHYEFDLAGIKTPIAEPEHAIRHRERYRYFFEPLVRLFGGSLRGKRVLDLGCNAGFWSLSAIEAGCDYVFGIDGRSMHVEQARLVFAVKGVDPARYGFLHADVLADAWGDSSRFDVVFCLGLLYHVNQPVQLLERAAAANSDILVIDTTVHPADEPVLALRHDDLNDPRNATVGSIVFFPSVAAVIEIVRSLGYHGVVLRPDFRDLAGSNDVRQGRRKAFVCAKRSDLSSLLPFAEKSFG